MSSCRLPSDPSLENLRKQAKAFLERYRSGEEQALALVRELDRSPREGSTFRLSDAQRATARLYGFPSWPKLVRHVETIQALSCSPHRIEVKDAASPAEAFLLLACLTYGADDPSRPRRALEVLASEPGLPASSIHVAAAAGDVAAVRNLLADDGRLASTARGPHRWDPLLYLAYSRVAPEGCDHLAAAGALLEEGADPNGGYLWEGECIFTALTGVFGGGEGGNSQPPHPAGLELARLLLDAGADPNDDQTLYNRLFRPDDDHLELLFSYGLGRGDGGPWNRLLGGSPDGPRIMLEDQLLFASANGFEDRVELLLNHGVDANGRGSGHPALRGRSAVELAIETGSGRALQALLSAGAAMPELDGIDRVLAALAAGDRGGVDALLARDRTLIGEAIARAPARVISAAELGRSEAVRLLVEHGFDVNHCDGRTALHAAAWNGDQAMVELLLSLGADPTIRDRNHDGPPAAWAWHNGHVELARRLEAG